MSGLLDAMVESAVQRDFPNLRSLDDLMDEDREAWSETARAHFAAALPLLRDALVLEVERVRQQPTGHYLGVSTSVVHANVCVQIERVVGELFSQLGVEP